MNERYTGPLAPQIRRHVQLRHSMGLGGENTVYTLMSFDRFLVETSPDAQTVTRQMVVDYLATVSHLKLATRHRHLSILRQFCRFLFQLNPDTYIPEPRLLPVESGGFRPHLYSLAEVLELMRLAGLLLPAASLRPSTYVTLIGLLWATGMRTGEAARLNLEDVDLAQGVLQIRQTKNFKSRLVPVHSSTVTALTGYLEQRARVGHAQDPTSAFFINERGKRLHPGTAKRTFLILTRQMGLKSAQGTDPRLHDFRHTFATRYLSGFYQSGTDPSTALPALATYLGHTHVTDTQLYLHPPVDLLQTAGARFASHVQAVANLTIGESDETC